MKENKLRSVIKTISWRILASLTTFIIVFIFTDEFTLSLGIASIEIISKMIFYYGHERIWNHIKFGKK